MALFGVRVVTDDSTDASERRAVVRTLALGRAGGAAAVPV